MREVRAKVHKAAVVSRDSSNSRRRGTQQQQERHTAAEGEAHSTAQQQQQLLPVLPEAVSASDATTNPAGVIPELAVAARQQHRQQLPHKVECMVASRAMDGHGNIRSSQQQQ